MIRSRCAIAFTLGAALMIAALLPPRAAQPFKVRLKHALFCLDLGAIPDPKHVFCGKRLAVQDADDDGIRAMVATLHVDLEPISE